jgi:uncharacterized membrane protein YphA (DoxX/SURF4 family)
LAVRLGLAAVLFWAAIPKLTDFNASWQSVAAYRLFPPTINQIIGVALPIVELVLAILLLVGLLSRYSAVLFGVMLIVFIAGIVSAWARGLNIACGCFGPGGDLTAGEQAKFGQEIARDLGFMVMTAFGAIWPKSKGSLDTLLGLDPPPRTRAQAMEDLAEDLVDQPDGGDVSGSPTSDDTEDPKDGEDQDG